MISGSGQSIFLFPDIDGPVKSMFSSKDAKNAKKRSFNINEITLRLCVFARDFAFLRMHQYLSTPKEFLWPQ
jgi:hypothetical protein